MTLSSGPVYSRSFQCRCCKVWIETTSASAYVVGVCEGCRADCTLLGVGRWRHIEGRGDLVPA